MKTRWIPEGSEERTAPDVAAVAYLYGTSTATRPAAIAYSGNHRNSPDFHRVYLSAERREEAVTEYFEGLRSRARQRSERLAKRREESAAFRVTQLKVGDVLTYSWGYDQTNVEFFRIVKVNAKSVELVEVASAMPRGEEGFMTGRVKATEEVLMRSSYSPDGKPFRKAVKPGYQGEEIVSMDFGIAQKWDGQERFISWYA